MVNSFHPNYVNLKKFFIVQMVNILIDENNQQSQEEKIRLELVKK